MYGTGIDKDGEICDLAVNLGIIKKSGSWFSYGEQRFQGRDKLKELIKSDKAFAKEIEDKVLEEMKTQTEREKREAEAKRAEAMPQVTETPITQTRAAAKAKLDIAIDDED